MYFLNTTRHLVSPPDDAKLQQLSDLLTGDIAPSAGTVAGMRSIQWMLSQDRLTMQAFSGWSSWDDLPRAEHSDMHVNNSKLICDFLGGLASPQEHTYLRLVGQRTFD